MTHLTKMLMLMVALALTVDCSCDEETTPEDGGTDGVVKFDLGADVGQTPDSPTPDQYVLPDTVATPDASSFPDLPPDQLVHLDGITTPSYEYVIDSMNVPSSLSDIAKYSLDLDNDGSKDNALGGLLASLALVMPTLDLEAAANLGIAAGDQITLMRLHTKSLTTDPAALIKVWIGKPETCCKTPTDATKCAAEAATTCYAGTYSFSPDPKQPIPNLMTGAISGGSMDMGPAPLKLRLELKGYGTLPLRLKGARIVGTPTASGVSAGIIGGAIDPKDLYNDVIPALAIMIDVIYKDPKTASDVKTAISAFLDTNGDGTVSGTELAKNPLAKTYMVGDVDLDGDFIKELSVGFGFTAVKATIK